jgi:tetratricopeptide (TPR) repeat protein
LNNLQEALRLAEEKKLPNNPNVQYHLGMVYAKLKQPALAREHFEQVLKIDPTYHDADSIKQELIDLKS